MTGTTRRRDGSRSLTKEPRAHGESRARTAPPSATGRRQIVLYAILIAIALIYIYPFLVQVATSFKTDAEAAVDPISLIPTGLDDGGVRAPVPAQRLPALVHELGDRHGLRHRSGACSSSRSRAMRSPGCNFRGRGVVFAAVDRRHGRARASCC